MMTEAEMGKRMRAAFVSNYINHHQIPFCNEMNRLLNGEFTFVQTEPMEAERVEMGWHEGDRPFYVRCWYEEPEYCRRLLLECDVVLFGGTDDESFIQERLRSGKLVIRLSERLYRTGQWKAVSPRGLKKKYLDHTRYRNKQVYLLCSGAYVPSDFHIVRAYPGKMYCWGYFPETCSYNLDQLFAGKGWETTSGEKVPYLLWAARMIRLKHPELALETAGYLKERSLPFHLDMLGDGEMRQEMEELCRSLGLEEQVRFLGFQPPEQVRRHMEKADIFLFTSDRHEGWGAVANEAMNSGCALVADHMIGAVPYLVTNGVNGLVYRDGRRQDLFEQVHKLVENRELCQRLGHNAYNTITGVWNAENAATRLLQLMEGLLAGGIPKTSASLDGCFRGTLAPCVPAPILTEGGARRQVKKTAREHDLSGTLRRF